MLLKAELLVTPKAAFAICCLLCVWIFKMFIFRDYLQQTVQQQGQIAPPPRSGSMG